MGETSEMELIYSLVGYPDETEWIEFKTGNNEPERIGKDISALANSAAYHGRARAYKLWGVEDETHALVGTSFNPYHKKAKGNQDLLIWLRRNLSHNANYEFKVIDYESVSFVVLEIQAAIGQPVSFDKGNYIREGSSTTRLVVGSEKEAELWRRLQAEHFEERVAKADVELSKISDYLDVDGYYELLGTRKPTELAHAIEGLCEQLLLVKQDNGRYGITNLGALLIARKLTDYPSLRKRVLRVVEYNGPGNLGIIEDLSFDTGYALALPKAEAAIMSLLPTEEYLDGAFRKRKQPYPKQAVRELLSNTVIHQNLSDATSGPLVCIYSNRIVFSNPGSSLISTERILNAQPRTRNNLLAGLLRQMGLCEEGGSGWDIAVAACESEHMAAPEIQSDENLGTQVTMFAGSAYGRMKKAERRSAVYWHACLQFSLGDSMNNQSLRERFGLDSAKKNMVAISRLIKECVEAGLIKEEDEEAGAKFRRYVPYWA